MYFCSTQQYDGDNERTQRGVPRVSKGGPVRATVDGNARRQRRYSSDESAAAESATEMENYLDQYQQSPMQPGEESNTCSLCSCLLYRKSYTIHTASHKSTTHEHVMHPLTLVHNMM